MTQHYAIRGGVEGRERLRILARVLHPTTVALFDRLPIGNGMRCLDVGCGGGDVTIEMARRVAPAGHATGVDIDPVKVELAEREAAATATANVTFRVADVHAVEDGGGFDVVYARFLLTHLPDPGRAIAAFVDYLRPGGLVVLEDTDCSAQFTRPETVAFRRYHELYYAAVRGRDGDPDIGLRLPHMLADAGFEQVGVNVVQPMGLEGEMKLLNPLTMESIADGVVRAGLATRDEIDATVDQLYADAADPRVLAGLPRIFQAWGRRPG